MNILVSNTHLTNYGGTELWTYSVVKNLVERGHNVTVFTYHAGEFTEHITQLCGVMLGRWLGGEFDLAIVNHNTCLQAIPDNIYKIFTSHSSFIDCEEPIDGANYYIAVTEEIKDRFPSYNMKVIHNGIDCKRYSPKKPVNKELTNVFVMSDVPDVIKGIEVASQLYEINTGRRLNIFGIKERHFNIEDDINNADMVVTYGRGIFEALACGRNVISADKRCWMKGFEGAGYITKDKYDTLKHNNLSARDNPISMTMETIESYFHLYNPEFSLRNEILRDYNIDNVVTQYLEIYNLYGKD